MSIRVHAQTEEVAGGRTATSAQPRRATASFTARLSSSYGPHPNPPFSAFGTTGAPLESLRCYTLSARSQKHSMCVGQLQPKPRNSQ